MFSCLVLLTIFSVATLIVVWKVCEKPNSLHSIKPIFSSKPHVMLPSTVVKIALILVVAAQSTVVHSKGKFEKPDCKRVQFERFFEIFSRNQTYRIAAFTFFSTGLYTIVPRTTLAGLKFGKYGLLFRKGVDLCAVHSLWQDSEGLMLAHFGLIEKETDFVENVQIGFSGGNDLSSRTYYFCDKSKIWALKLNYSGLLNDSDVFMKDMSGKCDLKDLVQTLHAMPEVHALVFQNKQRSMIILGVSLGIILLLVVIQQIISFAVDRDLNLSLL